MSITYIVFVIPLLLLIKQIKVWFQRLNVWNQGKLHGKHIYVLMKYLKSILKSDLRNHYCLVD